MGKPYLPNLKDLIAAGIDPHTGLPLKLIGGKPEYLVEDAMRSFRLIDEQNAINRFNWINLPDGLSGNLIERILYYKGQGAFAYLEEEKKFVFLPFTLAAKARDPEGNEISGLDIYGRFKNIQLVQFMGSTDKDTAIALGLPFKVRYDIKLDEQDISDLTTSAVILRDYSQQLSQTVLPMALRQEWIIRLMAETAAFSRTKLITGAGIRGVKVNSADQVGDVDDLARGVINAAYSGKPYVGIVGGVEQQELESAQGSMRVEDYLMAMQSYDNIRLSVYGLENGGIFEKKAHITNDELAMNGSSVGLVYQDALARRQEFADIVNSIWGLNINCVPSENVIGMDLNGDGIIADEEQASVENPTAAEEEVASDDTNV